MLIVQNYIVSEELLQEEFVCNLSKCKGACCWKGDFGAPLENDEVEKINVDLDLILPLLPEESKHKISESGFTTFYRPKSFTGTSLLDNGACVFLHDMESGYAKCSIETAYETGIIPFNKPISCHLYPLRINEDPFTGIKMLYYDRWEICSEACKLGQELKTPVYKFLKNAIIRHFGLPFFEELDAAAKHLERQDNQ